MEGGGAGLGVWDWHSIVLYGWVSARGLCVAPGAMLRVLWPTKEKDERHQHHKLLCMSQVLYVT